MEYKVIRHSDELMHYGVPKRSGRYPWGSGERPYQGDGVSFFRERLEEAKKKDQEKWDYTDVPSTNPLKKPEIKPNSNKAAQKLIMKRGLQRAVAFGGGAAATNLYLKHQGLPMMSVKQATIRAGAAVVAGILMDEIHYARTGKLVK